MTNNGNKVSDLNGNNKPTMTSQKDDDDTKRASITTTDSCTKLAMDNGDEPCGGSSVTWCVLQVTVCFICGIFFGIAFEKGRVFEPKTIRNQMVFENFIMLKMFLAATATGQLVFSFLSVFPWTKDLFKSALSEFTSCFSHTGILASGLGAFVLGVGMTLSGACPGMVLAQLGTWAPNAIFTFLGCLVGALSYGMLAPHIEKYTKPKKCYTNHTVPQKLKWPYIAVALPMAVCLGVVVFLLEYFWDYKKDLENLDRKLPPYDNIAKAVAWMPFAAGMLIGIIQLPLVLVVKDTMGGSSSYATLVSQWVVTKRLQEMFPYLAKKRCGVGNWWQVFYVGGAILGAAISALASDTMATAQGVTIQTAIMGGIMMLWGARFASGCTSGHGLSGMGLLSWLSFVAVPCMFGGGIATAFLMKASGALDDYVTSTFDA